MPKVLLTVLLVLMLIPAASAKPPTIVTSFSILEDLARQVAGVDADLRVLAPIGAEVHEWELTPRNFVDLQAADIVLYNGLNTEQWMGQVRATVRPGVQVVSLGEASGYPTLPIRIGDFAGDPDPHIWMHPQGAAAYVRAICDLLVELDPGRAQIYQANAQAYLKTLEDLHAELTQTLGAIPAKNRILITSEAAFIYFAHAFDLHHDAIWGTNTEQEGTPQQMMRIVRLLMEKRPPGIFWESTGSDRYARSLSADTRIPVYGPLYVDSLGPKGSGAETYIELMRSNARLLTRVLAP